MEKRFVKRMFCAVLAVCMLGNTVSGSCPDMGKNQVNMGAAVAEAADIRTPLFYTVARDAVVKTRSLKLNKRSSPSNSASIVGKLSKGDHVTVIGKSRDGKWYYLDDCSYVSAQYISLNSELPVSGVKKICSVINPEYVLDANGGGTSPGTNLQLWKDCGTSNQQFRIEYVGEGYYTIQDTHSGLYVDVDGGSAASANVQLWTYHGEAAQQFRIYNLGGGEYMIQPRCTSCVVNVSGGVAADGTNVWTYPLDETNACYWKIVDANASASDSAEETEILNRLQQMMNGEVYGGNYKVNTVYSGEYYYEQCKGFAKSVHKKLFGYSIGSTCSKPNNYKINISSSNTRNLGTVTNMTSSNVKAVFDKARAGDFIQVRRSHGGSHSMIYLSSDSDSVTVYECNTDGRNGIKKSTYTYQKFCEKNAGVSVYTAKSYGLA